MSKKSSEVQIVRATQSPMNPRQWSCELSCGHDVWITFSRRPKLPKAVVCHACIDAAKEGKS